MSRPQIILPRQFCECGNPVYKKQSNAWICKRCYYIESLYDQTNTNRENRALANGEERISNSQTRSEKTVDREMQYAEPYRVHLQRND